MFTLLYRAIIRRLPTLHNDIDVVTGLWTKNLLAFSRWSAIFGLSPANQADDGSFSLEWDGILMAAPKKRTTRSKKRLRMTHKWPKNKRGIDTCFYCGRPKLMHFLCKHCLEETLKETDKIRRRMIDSLKY